MHAWELCDKHKGQTVYLSEHFTICLRFLVSEGWEHYSESKGKWSSSSYHVVNVILLYAKWNADWF